MQDKAWMKKFKVPPDDFQRAGLVDANFVGAVTTSGTAPSSSYIASRVIS